MCDHKTLGRVSCAIDRAWRPLPLRQADPLALLARFYPTHLMRLEPNDQATFQVRPRRLVGLGVSSELFVPVR